MATRIERENAAFQVLEALRHNRRKREQRGELLVEGVQPINRCLAAGWPVRAVVAPIGHDASSWATGVRESLPDAEVIELAPSLFERLADREEIPELLLVARVAARATCPTSPVPPTAWSCSSTDPRARATSARSSARPMPSAPPAC